MAGLLIAGAAACQTTYTLRAIISSPKTVSLAVDGTQQLTITAGYDKGASIDVTNKSTFKSGDSAVATVSASGLVIGTAAGATNITVSYTESGVTKTVAVPVTVK
jgi:hypothetical protein